MYVGNAYLTVIINIDNSAYNPICVLVYEVRLATVQYNLNRRFRCSHVERNCVLAVVQLEGG